VAQYDDCIIFLLAKAYQKAHGCLKKRLLKHGLTPIQHLILEALWDEEGLSAGDIGKKLLLDGATLSGVLDRMNESGWIIKETDSEDKRILRIHLTRRSKRLKTSLTEERKQANEEILRDLTLEEKIIIKRLLRDIQG
jgi:DNA-binding MarR family transcriptional regulator